MIATLGQWVLILFLVGVLVCIAIVAASGE